MIKDVTFYAFCYKSKIVHGSWRHMFNSEKRKQNIEIEKKIPPVHKNSDVMDFVFTTTILLLLK